MKQDSISTSEFMEQQVVETSSVFTDFSTIAARGYNVISRARRNGRWWVLKSLEEKVRKHRTLCVDAPQKSLTLWRRCKIQTSSMW